MNSSMINWINPRDALPKKDEIVWVLYQHGKSHVPMSCEIMAGEVSYGNDGSCFVCTGDMSGKGSWGVYLTQTDYHCEQGICWTYDLHIPEYVEHDQHWGPRRG